MAKDMAESNEPQSPEDKHGPKYDNDASGWVRGMGPQSPYPTFDKTSNKGKNFK
jgi:hypothetical protein